MTRTTINNGDSGLVVRTALNSMFGDLYGPGYIANRWYIPDGLSGIAVGGASGANTIRLFPGYVRQKCTLSALGVRLTTGSAGGNLQLAVYATDAATYLPTGTALASTASITTASTGSVNSAISVQLDVGLYWFAANYDNAVAVAVAASGVLPAQLIGSATQANDVAGNVVLTHLLIAQTFGTWPDLTAGGFTENTGNACALIQFKVGSIP